MDRATFVLAESYEILKGKLADATKRRLAAVEAEAARVAKASRDIENLADLERRAQNELGASGKAKLTIDQALPADIRQALDKSRTELRPHQESLEGARRILKAQQEHHDKVYPTLDPKTPGGKFDREALEKSLAAAEAGVQEEIDRCDKIAEKVKRQEAARDAWFADMRKKAFSAETPASAAK